MQRTYHSKFVRFDEKMLETVESIKKHGVMMPGIVRPRPAGGYEVIAGHRRWRACELAGLKEMPAIVRDLNDDEATMFMVDTNIQREDILPSEKAHAYKMKYEALKHQGSKGGTHTADLVGETAGESGRTVQRYIRLAELRQELLDYVDIGKIPLTVGEKLSFLPDGEQAWIVDAIMDCEVFPSNAQAEQIKMLYEAGELTDAKACSILEEKHNKNVSVTIPTKKIRNYFPSSYTKTQIEDVIFALLEKWKTVENIRGEALEDARDKV